MIGIINVDMGNIKSVSNAIHSLGFDPLVLEKDSDWDTLTHLILPGVGAYSAAIQRFHQQNVFSRIQEFAESGRPILGICLGMQILSARGDEGGATSGLGLIGGHVERLNTLPGFTIPHVGWNNIEIKKNSHPVFEKIKTGVDFYFVHSYHFVCDSLDDVYAMTDYSQNFQSVVGHKNVLGFQFHPEKSQTNGLKLLENFCDWDGQC